MLISPSHFSSSSHTCHEGRPERMRMGVTKGTRKSSSSSSSALSQSSPSANVRERGTKKNRKKENEKLHVKKAGQTECGSAWRQERENHPIHLVWRDDKLSHHLPLLYHHDPPPPHHHHQTCNEGRSDRMRMGVA